MARKKNDGKHHEKGNFATLEEQLISIGLMLREVHGDGNCLFRALGDQLDGKPDCHLRHRLDVIKYIWNNKLDFEPFVEDDITFEEYVKNLAEPGTHAGNDCIVAFARLHSVCIVIHQLNTPLWQISGSEYIQPLKELHISYHNGEHYNSVRKLGDCSSVPTNFKLSTLNQITEINSFSDVYKYENQTYASNLELSDDSICDVQDECFGNSLSCQETLEPTDDVPILIKELSSEASEAADGVPLEICVGKISGFTPNKLKPNHSLCLEMYKNLPNAKRKKLKKKIRKQLATERKSKEKFPESNNCSEDIVDIGKFACLRI